MMNCGQCQRIEDRFNQKAVTKKLEQYQKKAVCRKLCKSVNAHVCIGLFTQNLQHDPKKGPDLTTRLLIETLKAKDVAGLTLLDIGGGLGAIQHELLDAGVTQAINFERR